MADEKDGQNSAKENTPFKVDWQKAAEKEERARKIEELRRQQAALEQAKRAYREKVGGRTGTSYRIPASKPNSSSALPNTPKPGPAPNEERRPPQTGARPQNRTGAGTNSTVPKSAGAESGYVLRPNRGQVQAPVPRKAAPPPPKAPEKPKKKPVSSLKLTLRAFAVTAVVLIVLYCVAIFSDIPFVKKWRTLYIETAMGTLSHHWLATAFIPPSVIDEAMKGYESLDASQSGVNSDWNMSDLPGAEAALPWEKEQDRFFRIYPEIDKDSFQAYLSSHGDECFTSDNYLLIDKAGRDDGGTSIQTTKGDQVLAIDTVNGITILKVAGEGYVGKLAIIKDPEQVSLELAADLGSTGQRLRGIVEDNDAALAINASGFLDPNGQGNGGRVYGLVISNGKLINQPEGGTYKTIGFDKNSQLYIGSFTSASDFRDAVEFKPALVINGEKMVSGSAGWGIQPRSAIGQTKDGQVLLLIIDGRAPGYSIGCTVEDLADIMLRYGAEQACNLDGGSSSLMYYNGREITKPSAGNKDLGRLLPDAFVVSKRK